ncbi:MULTISPECIES: hypothetical protein [unclassified Agrococcus]|uniref:hypothetical protein n=1 Tax=unclassified Agrococcus TaxID=2615065 RepID=UPI003614D7CE
MLSKRAAVSVVVASAVVVSVGASVTGCAIDAAASSATVAIIDGRMATDLEAFDCFDIEQPGDGPASDHGAGLNTWSRSKAGARQVCQLASGGRHPVGPEIDRHGPGKFEHYHRSTRSAAHCFFGNPRR